ncbi:MAG: Uma2 family endonuclease [Anaerolineae bacterium]|nr:Uma2 family endonuclease [Anaerolineae bacterium]
MIARPQAMTAEAFDAFALLPENRERRLEWIDGEMTELVSNDTLSNVTSRLMARLEVYVTDHDLGYTTGPDGGYIIQGNRLIPDGAFMPKAHLAKPSGLAYNPVAPALVVEVLSPTDHPEEVQAKVGLYLDAGIGVWLADPEARSLTVYTPGQGARLLRREDTLDGGDILPGFTLPLSKVFAE